MPLRKVVRQRLLEEMLGSVAADWKILVVDQYSVNVLGAACRNRDVLSKQVAIVEDLRMRRQPLPQYAGVYFLSPTAQSVDLFIQDWEAGNRLYHEAHLFFTNRLDERLFEKMGRSVAGRYIRTLKELNVDFFCKESEVFVAPVERDLSRLLGPARRSCSDLHLSIADKLVSLCCTLNENPVIRHQSSEVAGLVANAFQRRLEEYIAVNPSFKPPTENRATLLVLDRSVDCVAPLIHEFTYQAMLHDLLGDAIQDTKYSYETVNQRGEKQTKEALLDEADPMWVEYRHRHIHDVQVGVAQKFQQFKDSYKGPALKGKAGKDVSLAELAEIARAEPVNQEKISRFSLHIDIADRLHAAFRAQNLADVANLEQDLATGETPDGAKVKAKDLQKEVVRCLSAPNVNAECRLRLLLIYFAVDPTLKDAVKQELMVAADFGAREFAAVSNMQYLQLSADQRSRMLAAFAKAKRRSKPAGADDLAFNRFVPLLKAVAEAELRGELNPGDFPYAQEPPPSGATSSSGGAGAKQTGSLRPRAKPTFGHARTTSSSSFGDGDGDDALETRLIIFIVGGVTFSEIRAMYEIAREMRKGVVIGGTSILAPRRFIEEVTSIPPAQ
eukprot:TRINITY_DN30882_c0_g1_i1.p1 TRINITY_DN30882_c0_g1~~TRINITY_DN30882_c0_g1_i1.p1  ORF type:complete len:613 (-),score=124.44 TRINITY_DN30882_c0_g1_i1:76-1914(-)